MNNEIEEDLIKRDVELVAVVVSNKDGKMQLIGYDQNNNANFISQFVDGIEMYEKRAGEGGMYAMATIGKKK